ncbi:MAG TPA: ATPase, T2SS/T4P/T4SS family [Longimicrobiales bacterium]|nr:ATPase, T2SS/T4P/T4SS family [Longimicrobiales bacterium]
MTEPDDRARRTSAPRVLGQLLRAAEAITEAELQAALNEQRWTRERLGVVLIRNGTEPEVVARGLAEQLRVPFVAGPLAQDGEAASLLDPASAERARMLPLRIEGGAILAAVDDPLDAGALDELRFRTGRRVEPVVVTPQALDDAFAALAGVPASSGNAGGEARPTTADASPPTSAAVADAGVVALVERILAASSQVGASDIHVEPRPEGLGVRARVDGELRRVFELPGDAAPAVVSRLKIMAGLDISVRRMPQDGRASVRLEGRPLDLRVSTLPSVHGEKVVLRMLDPEHAGMGMDELGLPPGLRIRLDRLLLRAHGALLVTGPTGSGKTTTLYAVLGSVDREHRNVVTLEDPIEYRLPGLTQVQVQVRAGFTFAAALRAVLRQDPDVVMVGEMRDPETAEVGMAAALTGHLVLSTLHTNDAASAVSRLIEMGVPPYMIAAGLSGVLAQRLVRRLCRGCRRPVPADPAELASLGLPEDGLAVHEAGGCAGCGGRGYRGRTGIFELLEIDAGVREAILRREGPDRIRGAAADAGAAGLPQHAAARLAAGETSLAEVAPFLALLAS